MTMNWVLPALYGITMQERGVSTVLTANLNELSKEMKIK